MVNFWKYVKALVTNNKSPSGRYVISDRFNTYGLGVEHIRSIPITLGYTQPIFKKVDGSQIYRPLTLLESLEVVVRDYNTDKNSDGITRTEKDKQELLRKVKYTCTGIACKAEGTEIKIIPECQQLINIPANNTKSFLEDAYNTLEGITLNTNTGKYNQLLKESEVNSHSAWIASLGGTQHGRDILKEYSKIIFKLLAKEQQTKGMEFYVMFNNTKKDELRTLSTWGIKIYSDAVGPSNLDFYARFLLAVPSKKLF